MKIIEKIIVAITIIFITLFSITNQTYVVKAETAGQLIDEANSFIANGEADQSGTIDQAKMNEAINLMFNIALAIGTFIAFVVGIIVGIKLMVAATADEKAHYKKILITYVVGCVIIFGAVGIWRLVVTTVNNVTPDGTPTQQGAQSTAQNNNGNQGTNKITNPTVEEQISQSQEKIKQLNEEYKNPKTTEQRKKQIETEIRLEQTSISDKQRKEERSKKEEEEAKNKEKAKQKEEIQSRITQLQEQFKKAPTNEKESIMEQIKEEQAKLSGLN